MGPLFTHLVSLRFPILEPAMPATETLEVQIPVPLKEILPLLVQLLNGFSADVAMPPITTPSPPVIWLLMLMALVHLVTVVFLSSEVNRPPMRCW